uniref:Thymus, brain and testes associated n=1 Tax=Jaculus jaculus TaxID=51337 RepID=A0A8C5LF42_JACJA
MAMEAKTQLAEQPVTSPKVSLKPEKKPKPAHKPQNTGDSRAQKELMTPGIVDFGLIQESFKAPHPLQTPGTYRFGRLSHHSFFSRHHPHPQHVTHIQDSTGKPVCVVRDESSLVPLPPPTFLSYCLMGMPTISDPIGDPQSNRNPQLSSDTWKKELKELTSRVAFFTKEDEPVMKEQKEEPPREQGAKYSAETGRLIPASSQALTRRSSRQGQRNHSSSRDRGVQDLLLQDQELLILELLCQVLQTDSLRAIQFWLLYAPPKEKDLALRLLQTAVAQLLPHPLTSIPAEKLLSHLQDIQDLTPEKQLSSSSSSKKMKTSPLPKCERPECMGKAQVLRVHSSEDTEEKVSESKAEG